MKYGWCILPVVILMGLMLCAPAEAEETITRVRIGIYLNRPLFFWDNHGEPAGFFVDLVRAVARESAWDPVFVPTGRGKETTNRASGDIDLAFTVKSSSGKGQPDRLVGREVLLNCRGVVYAPGGSSISRIADLAGQRVALVTADAHSRVFDQICRAMGLAYYPVPVSDYAAGFKAVQGSGADACLTDDWFGQKNAESYGLQATSINVNPSQWVVSCDSGQNRELIETVDKFVHAWKHEAGSPYHTLYQYWLGKKYDQPLPLALSLRESEFLKKHSKIRVAFDGYFPPYSFLNENGVVEGLSVDVFRMLADRLDLQLEVVPRFVWKDLFRAAVDREVDVVATMVQRPERLKRFRFTRPYIHKSLVVMTRKGDRSITERDDIAGKTLAMVRGYQYVKRILEEYPHIRPYYVDTMLKGLNAVATGKADAMITFFGAGRHYQLKYGLNNLQFAAIYDRSTSNECIGVRNDWPELVMILDKALYGIGSSEWIRLQEKWNADEALVVYFQENIVSRKEWIVFIVLACAAGLTAILGGAAYFWNRVLKQRVREKTEDLATELAANQKMAVELEQNEQKFRYLFNHVLDGLIICDQDGTILEANDTACRLLGYNRASLINTAVFLLDSSGRIETIFAKGPDHVKESGVFLEIGLTSKDHKEVPVEAFIQPFEYEQQRCCLIGARDISEKKQTEQERDHLQTQLQQARKMEAIGRLAGGVAHDYNNMLMVILGNTEVVMDDLGADHPTFSNLKEIRNAAVRSADLTRQLLAFARKQFIQPQILDLNTRVTNLLPMLSRLTGEHIDIQWNPEEESRSVKMDPSQVDQILINLLSNSRDAIEGTGSIGIEISQVAFDEDYCRIRPHYQPGDYIRLSVADTGRGMDQSTRNLIFEPFFTTKEIGQGTGMGLSTVYGIVRQNSGFITVYSEPGEGTTLNVYLPRCHASSEAPLLKEDDIRYLGGDETILVVDDEAAILRMARTILEQAGYSVLSGRHPREALSLAEACIGTIDLLLTDVIMPEMDGGELFRKIRSRHPAMTAIYMSGYPSNYAANREIIQSGMTYIQKPFSKQLLLKKIRKTLDSLTTSS